MNAKLSRREFLSVSAVAAAGAAIAACQPQTVLVEKEKIVEKEVTKVVEKEKIVKETVQVKQEVTKIVEVEKEKVITATPAPLQEAPDIRVAVQAGKLPPLAERLPKDPAMIKPIEEIGEYGGIWRRVGVGATDTGIFEWRLLSENLVSWEAPNSAASVIPNLVKSWEANADSTEFTFYLREGMKWSDGEPFTADDWIFWYENILQQKDLTPAFPKDWSDPVGQKPMTLAKVDDYTFKMTFASSYGLLIMILAGPTGAQMANRYSCQHYLKAFHPQFVAAADLEKMTKDRKFENWWQLFADRQDYRNPDNPRIYPWKIEIPPPTTPVVYKRNVYYYKIDVAGDQLPYIDAISTAIVENIDMANLKAVSGDIDMQFRHMLWGSLPLFKENAPKLGYRVLLWTQGDGSNFTIFPNFTHKDPVMHELIHNKKFRVALSLGIDRAKINEFCYMGMGTPRQASLLPQAQYFKPEHATKYAEHDPDQANKLLDEIGLDKRDAEGMRLRPDGQKLSIVIEYAPIFGPHRDALELLVDDWKEIGIRMTPKEEARTLLTERQEAGEEDMIIRDMNCCLTPLVQPWWWLPYSSGGYSFAPRYAQWWNSGGTAGEEPPEQFKKQLELYYTKIRGAPNAAELDKLAQEFIDFANEELWLIGTVGVLPSVGVATNAMRNVPEEAVNDWLQMSPRNGLPEQFYIKK